MRYTTLCLKHLVVLIIRKACLMNQEILANQKQKAAIEK